MDLEVQSEFSKLLYIAKSHQAKVMKLKIVYIHIDDFKVKHKHKYKAQKRLQCPS